LALQDFPVHDRAGFSWWEAWGPRGVGLGSSLKLGEQVEAPKGSVWGGGGTAPPQKIFSLWCING